MAVAQGSVGEELREALATETILRQSERYGTGAVIFWSQSQSRNIVLPPFNVTKDGVFRGSAETLPLRSLVEEERILGLILVTWGSYALGIFKGDKLVDCKAGTGYIHKRHRKGGRSEKRFARRTEEQKKDFLRRVANHIEQRFKPYCLEQIFIGGNRLIAKPLSEECRYLKFEAQRIPKRFINARHANTGALVSSAQEVNTSLVFTF